MELFIQNFIDMFVDMSFYIMLGLLLVGILNTFVKKEQMMKHLGRREFSSVVKASMIGVPLPLCSCGVVPTAVGLKKSGASNGAVVSFLISTPQTGVDSILATYSMMGMGMAVFRPLAAFFSGIIGGGIVNTLTKNDEEIVVGEVSTACGCSTSEVIEETSCGDSGKKETEETSCCCDNSEEAHELSFVRKIKRVFTYAYGEFLDEIAMHFIIGILIGTTITTFVPTNFFVNIGINQGILSMLSMVIIGLPMYICSTASIPIAISFLTKGLSLGSVFVFLFTGPVTNMASIMVLKKSLGTKITRSYIGLVITCAVVFGYVLDYVVGVIPLEILESHAHMGHGHGTSLTQSILALVLCILMIRSIVGVRYLKKC